MQPFASTAWDTEAEETMRSFKVQAHIAQHPEQLFREFRLTPDEDMQLLIPWIWVSDEVEDRLETQEYPPKPERLMAATFQMLQQIDGNFPRSRPSSSTTCRSRIATGDLLVPGDGCAICFGTVFQRIWSPVPEFVTLTVIGICLALALSIVFGCSGARLLYG